MISIKRSAIRLLGYLDDELVSEGYPEAPSWGYAFTLLAALEGNYEPHSPLVSNALENLLKQDKTSKNYSWEFVVYAWQRASHLSDDIDFRKVPYGEKGTRMINWTLLRQLNRLRERVGCQRSRAIIRCIRYIYTLSDGQILDEFRTRSLQYHAFCLFVLVELFLHEQKSYLKDWLISGVKFSFENCLSDGVALYIGRGQEQIFGYGALIFAGEFVLARWPNNFTAKDRAVLDKITSHLLSFQRGDGSYPLVLNADQPERPRVSFFKDRPNGWFGYNTLYDYQPFLAYCLLRASKFSQRDFK